MAKKNVGCVCVFHVIIGHITVTKAMKNRNGIQITRLPEGGGDGMEVLGKKGGHSTPATVSKECRTLMTRKCMENGNTAENSTLVFTGHSQI